MKNNLLILKLVFLEGLAFGFSFLFRESFGCYQAKLKKWAFYTLIILSFILSIVFSPLLFYFTIKWSYRFIQTKRKIYTLLNQNNHSFFATRNMYDNLVNTVIMPNYHVHLFFIGGKKNYLTTKNEYKIHYYRECFLKDFANLNDFLLMQNIYEALKTPCTFHDIDLEFSKSDTSSITFILNEWEIYQSKIDFDEQFFNPNSQKKAKKSVNKI